MPQKLNTITATRCGGSNKTWIFYWTESGQTLKNVEYQWITFSKHHLLCVFWEEKIWLGKIHKEKNTRKSELCQISISLREK